MEVLIGTGSNVSKAADDQFAEAIADVSAASRHLIATALTLCAAMRERPDLRVTAEWKQNFRAAVEQACSHIDLLPEPGQPPMPTIDELLNGWRPE